MNKRNIIIAVIVVAVLLLSGCNSLKLKSTESIPLLLLDANDYKVAVTAKYRTEADKLCIRRHASAYFALRDTIDIKEMREEYEQDLPRSLQSSCPGTKITNVTLPEVQRPTTGEITNE